MEKRDQTESVWCVNVCRQRWEVRDQSLIEAKNKVGLGLLRNLEPDE